MEDLAVAGSLVLTCVRRLPPVGRQPAPQVAVSPEEAARILPKAELQKLLTLLLGEGSTMEPDLEDAMLKEVEGFLEAALISGCSMARR